MAKDKANRLLWVKITQHGSPVWVNTIRLRAIEAKGNHGRCTLVFNTRHRMECDETIEEVMEALGHPMPPRPPVETHEHEAGVSLVEE